MDLTVIWFMIIAILFMGFFFLEGFDFGVGILLPFLGKKDEERRMIINTIGPFWDGNEVWLITAGGAIFAAFPHWYATMFSGFYLALLVILVCLILRVVYFEFRSKKENVSWRKNWDIIMFISSLTLSILWGTALSNLVKGVPIDHTMNYVGGFFDLLSPYTLFGGITALLVFTFHGAIFLSLKASDIVEARAKKIAKKLGIYSISVMFLFALLSYFQTDLYQNKFALIAAISTILFGALSWYAVIKEKFKYAMLFSGVNIALWVSSLFLGLFPRVMVSSINSKFDLTIYNASSSPYTLSLMTKVALIFVPLVLGYQAWTYWIFRKRVSVKDINY